MTLLSIAREILKDKIIMKVKETIRVDIPKDDILPKDFCTIDIDVVPSKGVFALKYETVGGLVTLQEKVFGALKQYDSRRSPNEDGEEKQSSRIRKVLEGLRKKLEGKDDKPHEFKNTVDYVAPQLRSVEPMQPLGIIMGILGIGQTNPDQVREVYVCGMVSIKEAVGEMTLKTRYPYEIFDDFKGEFNPRDLKEPFKKDYSLPLVRTVNIRVYPSLDYFMEMNALRAEHARLHSKGTEDHSQCEIIQDGL